MKKNCYFSLFLMSLLFFGCSEDDPVTIIEGEKVFNLDQKELEFSADGGTQILKVETDNLEYWEAYSSISWISLGKPDIENGTLIVTVAPTNDLKDMSGYIVLYSEGVGDLKIPVVQKGLGIIHDRSTKERLHLKGTIESVEMVIDFIHHWDNSNKWILQDMKFNESGNVTGFYLELGDPLGYTNVYEYTIAYDSQNRMSVISATSNIYIEETGQPFVWTIALEYGNHGKYLATENIFDIFQNIYYCYGLYDMWIPKMIKDLTKVTFTSSIFLAYDGLTYSFDVNGDQATGWLEIELDGELLSEEYMHYTFENNFTKTATSYHDFLGMMLAGLITYEVNAESGNILSSNTDIDMFGEGVIIKVYNDDKYNTLSEYEEYLTYGYQMTLEYNDKYDVISVSNAYMGTGDSIGYEYDVYGNWSKATIGSDSYSREIQYKNY